MPMPTSIEKLRLAFDLDLGEVSCSYSGLDRDGNEVGVNSSWSVYLGYLHELPPEEAEAFASRTKSFLYACESMAGTEPLELEVQGVRGRINSVVRSVHYYGLDGVLVLEVAWPGAGWEKNITFLRVELSSAHRRLLDSLLVTLERKSWDHLRENAGAAPKARLQVFISYRSGHDTFAEALAERLGKEGVLPWFDKWDILAGDSVPGKIEEAFRDSQAFIPILTADYQDGKWATDELMTAITKRLEQGYRIAPALLEDCERPELIRHLRYVDFSAQDAETYEAKIAELIDGIYGLELNPFRG